LLNFNLLTYVYSVIELRSTIAQMERSHLEKTEALERKVHELQVKRNAGIIDSLRRASPFTPQPKIIHVTLSPEVVNGNTDQLQQLKKVEQVAVDTKPEIQPTKKMSPLVSNMEPVSLTVPNDKVHETTNNKNEQVHKITNIEHETDNDMQIQELKTPQQQNVAKNRDANPSVDYNSSWISA